jgi:hypothetical protein
MIDADDAELKAEIDAILNSIQETMKKIESVVPLKPDIGPATGAGDRDIQSGSDS